MGLVVLLHVVIATVALAGQIQNLYVATFDNAVGGTLGNKLNTNKIGRLDALYFSQFGLLNLANATSKPISPVSSPNVAAYGPLAGLLDDRVYFTTKLTGSGGTFDLHSFSYGCIYHTLATYIPVPCVVTIAGYKGINVQVAGAEHGYESDDSLHPNMKHVGLSSAWRGIDTVRFSTRFPGGQPSRCLTIIDNINYTHFA